MLSRKRLESASGEYQVQKYSEEFYTYHLEILKNARNVDENVERAVRLLFLWKLGKVKNHITPKSPPIKIIFSLKRYTLF